GFTLLIFSLFHYEKLYTFFTFLFSGLFLLFHFFVLKTSYLGRFYLAYAIGLIGFFGVNGILTGGFTQNPVVWYNNSQNLGIRLGTIPFEDVFYGMLLVLMVVTVFERL